MIRANDAARIFAPQLERRHEKLVDERDAERLKHRLGVYAAAFAGDQHLGARRPFGVRQVAMLFDDERAAQRNHHQHTHQPAGDRENRDARDVEIVAHQQNGGDREHYPG